MIVTIHQPDFLSWLGFFNKVTLSDLLVIGDHVQYRSNGYQNRNRIKTVKGSQWLTIPIVHSWGEPIYKVRALDQEQNGSMWNDVHLRTLQVNYGKAKYYDQYIGIFEKIYKKRIALLSDYNLEFMNAIFEILGIKIPIRKTSEMTLTQSKTDLIVEIIQKVGGDRYLSGLKGSKYMDESVLESNGIKLLYNNYEHPVYTQQFMQQGFLSNMSVIDLIFNHGPESLDIIKSGFRGFELTSDQRMAVVNVRDAVKKIEGFG
jgi:hypothetical protein